MVEGGGAGVTARGYSDLRDHIRALDDAGLLVRVDIPINKDTELHPLVRWQFRGGFAPEARKAFLFTNIFDAKGRRYDMPVLVGAIGSSRRIYEVGMGVGADESHAAWTRALRAPTPPRVVETAVCQEVVIEGAALNASGHGLDGFPVPISTPGWDNAPYLTGIGFITKDPDTGIQNLGTYRAQVKAPRRIGMNTSVQSRTGGYYHWLKHKARGERMPAAYVIGGPISVAYAAMWKVPEELDEIAVAGALVGAPINVVKARTVDLYVPAEAESVIEGYVDTEYLEPEAPFGESHGHVNTQEYNGVMEVTAITRRRDAIFMSYISQVHPNETTEIRAIVFEHGYLDYLHNILAIKGVVKVRTHRPLTGNRKVIFLVVKNGVPRSEIWRALHGVCSQQRAAGKVVIAVNEDIDPDNLDAVMWAIAFRSSPHRDLQVVRHRDGGHSPSGSADEDSAMLIDATLKHEMPPISLPTRPYMERARAIWEGELGLPKIVPESPWFGYSLGKWPAALAREAERAVRGEYWQNGELAAQRRRKDVAMNTEVTDFDED
ncbi:MAG TPA: UbiD family decarboxylase [Xanthobacteraceae bacterium]